MPNTRPSIRHRIHPAQIWSLIRNSVSAWIDDYAPSMGAALAYYTLFSLAPLLLIVIAQELPRHFHASPYSYYGQALMLIAAVLVGMVVESARLGRRLDATVQ